MKTKLVHSALTTVMIILCLFKILMYITALTIIHPRNVQKVALLSRSDCAFSTQDLTPLNWAVLEKHTLAAKENTRQQAICDMLILILLVITRYGKNSP